jgi:hypothetical protein
VLLGGYWAGFWGHGLVTVPLPMENCPWSFPISFPFLGNRRPLVPCNGRDHRQVGMSSQDTLRLPSATTLPVSLEQN